MISLPLLFILVIIGKLARRVHLGKLEQGSVKNFVVLKSSLATLDYG